jgi:hypothetical protein
MAQRPDGKSAATERVVFTRPAAERIAKAVRTVEGGDRAGNGLTFNGQAFSIPAAGIRAATFDGPWPIGTQNVVTFTRTPNVTATVTNISWPITETAYTAEPCIVGKDGTAWYLVVPRLETVTSVFATLTQELVVVSATSEQTVASGLYQSTFASGAQDFSVLTDISISATLDTNNCSITIGKTASTANVKVITTTATAFFASGTTTISVCSATATAVMITQTATSTILRLRLP